jgi:hypothetical protein
MPQIQMTRSVRIALIVLRVYLVVMLALILVGFLRREKAITESDAKPAATAPATPVAPLTGQ